jgi:hypothetical protein
MDNIKAQKIGREVFELGNQFITKLNAAQINKDSLSPFQLLLSMVFYDTNSFLKSIVLLGAQRLGMQANILMRSLFETYVTIKFLYEKREFVDRYIDYARYVRKCRIEDLERHGEKLFQESPTRVKERETIFREGEEVTIKHGFKKRKWYPPAFPSFEHICKAVGSGKDYDYVYRHLSSLAHFDVSSTTRFDLVTVEGCAEINEYQSDAIEAIQGACALTLAIYVFIDEEHNLGLGPIIDEHKKRLDS